MRIIIADRMFNSATIPGDHIYIFIPERWRYFRQYEWSTFVISWLMIVRLWFSIYKVPVSFHPGNGHTGCLLPRSDRPLFHFPNHCTAMTLLGIHFRHWWLRSLPAYNFCLYRAVILRRNSGNIAASFHYYRGRLFVVLWDTSVMSNSLSPLIMHRRIFKQISSLLDVKVCKLHFRVFSFSLMLIFRRK